MAHQCQNIFQHECFEEYDENKYALNIDENNVATMGIHFLHVSICTYII